jgi:TonB family protein
MVIIHPPGLALCRRSRLNSNVRRHMNEPQRTLNKICAHSLLLLALLGTAICAHAQQQALAKRAVILNISECAPQADDYPRDALRDGRQGTVRLQITVSSSGDLKSIVISRTSGTRSLDQVALRKFRACRFGAATTDDGTPVEATFEAQWDWRLN